MKWELEASKPSVPVAEEWFSRSFMRGRLLVSPQVFVTVWITLQLTCVPLTYWLPTRTLKTCRRACREVRTVEFGVFAASDETVNCSPLSEKLWGRAPGNLSSHGNVRKKTSLTCLFSFPKKIIIVGKTSTFYDLCRFHQVDAKMNHIRLPVTLGSCCIRRGRAHRIRFYWKCKVEAHQIPHTLLHLKSLGRWGSHLQLYLTPAVIARIAIIKLPFFDKFVNDSAKFIFS